MDNQEMTLGQWVGTLIITCIPCINIIMLIVWAISAENVNKKRWAQAQLIITVIAMVLSLIFYALLGASMAALLYQS